MPDELSPDALRAIAAYDGGVTRYPPGSAYDEWSPNYCGHGEGAWHEFGARNLNKAARQKASQARARYREMSDRGLTPNEMAEEHGITIDAVRNALRRYNIRLPATRKAADHNLERDRIIVEMGRRGEPLTEIIVKARCAARTAKRILAAHGIEVRKQGGREVHAPKIRRRLAEGQSQREIAAALGCGRSTVSRVAREWRKEKEKCPKPESSPAPTAAALSRSTGAAAGAAPAIGLAKPKVASRTSFSKGVKPKPRTDRGLSAPTEITEHAPTDDGLETYRLAIRRARKSGQIATVRMIERRMKRQFGPDA